MENGVTKILVSAKVLQDLIAKDPQIEVEILHSAVPQIVGMINKRVLDHTHNINSQVDKYVEIALSTLRSKATDRFRMPEDVKIVIRKFLADECREEARAAVLGTALTAARDAAQKVGNEYETNIRAVMQQAINDAVSNLRAQIKQIAEQEVIALLRGASNLNPKA